MLEFSSSLELIRKHSRRSLAGKYIQDEAYDHHKINGLPLSRWVLHTLISMKYISKNMTLDNYDGLTDPWEHVQNMHNSLELVI
jgi:hypothetical protein